MNEDSGTRGHRDDAAAGFAQLLTPTGWMLVNGLPPYDEEGALRLGERMRAKGIDPALAAAALTQSRLRARARAKFADFADEMLFTQAGLEQATRFEVAALHARRYVRAGAQRVADLGCGLGADSLAFASAGLAVLAVERDEMTASAALVNLRAFPEVEVRHADVMAVDLDAERIDAVFADPARRAASGRRVFDPESYSPSLSWVLGLREARPLLGVKVAPGIPHDAIPTDAEAQWISVDGDVVEAGLWFAGLREEVDGLPVRRGALVIRDGRAHRLFSAQTVSPDLEQVGSLAEVGGMLHEPDGAVIRASLIDQIADAAGARQLDSSIAYLLSEEALPEDWRPFASSYRVLDAMPFGVKRLRAYLRERDVGRLTIKKRGTAVDPQSLRKQLGLSGEAEATVVLTRVLGKQSMLVVEPA